MNDIYVTWRSFSVGTTPVWSQPVKDSLSDVKTIIENGKKMLEAARELGPIDVDPEKNSVPIYNDSTTVKCFLIEHNKKYKCDPHGIGFTLIPNTDMADYDKYVEPKRAVLVNRPLLYFLNCVNLYKRVAIRDFKGKGEIFILPDIVKQDYELWLEQ